MPYFYAGCLMLSRWKLRFAARLGTKHTKTPETKIMFRIRRWAGIRKGTSAGKVVKEKLLEVGPLRAEQHSLTRSMPGSPRRRKRPRRTAHLCSRAPPGPAQLRQLELWANSGPSRSPLGAARTRRGAFPQPRARGGRARGGALRLQRSGRSPRCRSARERQGPSGRSSQRPPWSRICDARASLLLP